MENDRGVEVSMGGEPVVLIGNRVRVGDKAPDFIVTDSNLSSVTFSSMNNEPHLISSVVSLDTPVCDTQAKRFNEEAADLIPSLRILVISMDLPFAQQRWCGRENVDQVETYSDHRDASFGTAYGVLIKNKRLLARSVFLVDNKLTVRYKEIVKEITDEPNYDKLYDAMKSISE
ncbi:MAG: thiol peroxidase [Planctomycetes bacterium]|nr:thiol peroxidase [Planctomycetota bacterium]